MNTGIKRNGTGGKGWLRGWESTQEPRPWVVHLRWLGTSPSNGKFDIRNYWRRFRRWHAW